jgi:clumping factor A
MKAGFCNSLFYILLILLIIPGMTPGLASALGDSQNTNSGHLVSESDSSNAGNSISNNGSSDSGNSISDSGSSNTGNSVSGTDNKSSDSGNSSSNSDNGNSSTNPDNGNSSTNSTNGNSSTNPTNGNSSTNPTNGNSSTNSNKVDSGTSSDSGSSDSISDSKSSDNGDSKAQNVENTSSDNESSSNESSDNGNLSSENNSSDSSSESSSSSSGSGLSVISSGEPSSNIAVKEYSTMNVMAGYPVKFDFVENSTCITYIKFDPKKTFRQTTAVVEELKNTSALVSTPAPGKIYKNVNIWVGEGAGLPTALKDGSVGFRVEKAWIKEQNISDSLITLQRYDNGWKSISTKKVGEDENYVYFEAETPGYSCFAITDSTGQSGDENKTLVEQEITKTLKTLGANNSMIQNPMRAGRIVMSVSFPLFMIIAGYFVVKKKI